MRELIGLVGLLGALGLGPAEQSAVAQSAPHTDYIGADRAETGQSFRCEDSRVELSFAELYRAEEGDLLLRRQVVLASFSVSGRTIALPSRRLIEREFGRFAWIERITVRCTRFNRIVDVLVRGMLAEAWAAYGQDGEMERPEPVTLYLIVAEDGSVRVG